MVLVKGLVVRSNEKHVLDGMLVQRITIEVRNKKTLCFLPCERNYKVEAGDYVKVQGVLKKFGTKDNSFGKYLMATSLEKTETGKGTQAKNQQGTGLKKEEG